MIKSAFNSKTLFKDGDPVSLQLIFPGAIQTCDNTTMCHTYIQNNTGSSDKHSQTQLTRSYKNISINTYTMYTHHTLSFMHKKEQNIINNKHVE